MIPPGFADTYRAGIWTNGTDIEGKVRQKVPLKLTRSAATVQIVKFRTIHARVDEVEPKKPDFPDNRDLVFSGSHTHLL